MKLNKNFLLYLTAVVLFGGCAGSVQPESNKAITSKKVSQMSTLDVIDDDIENEDELEELELYFADTQGKIFYSGNSNSRDVLDSQTYILLSNIFTKGKKKLPKVGRRSKLNIAIEIAHKSIKKDKILSAIQKYILSNKKYAISNTDGSTLRVLKKILKKEKDGLYKKRKKVSSKSASDVILFAKVTRRNGIDKLEIKLISKNGSILSVQSKNINTKQKSTKKWIEVNVPRVNSSDQVFEVMRYPVNVTQYKGVGGDKSIANVSYRAANRFCKTKMDADIVTPYVFEAARTSLSISRPTSSIKSEIIAPFDEEDDEIYMINEDDKLDGGDSNIISFRWSSEKYLSVSNMLKSTSTTFRCMREK